MLDEGTVWWRAMGAENWKRSWILNRVPGNGLNGVFRKMLKLQRNRKEELYGYLRRFRSRRKDEVCRRQGIM